MLISGKWLDPVIGIDIHLIQPPGPVPPVPVPHPFIGIVYDPMGLVVGMAISAAVSGLFGGSFSGPVMINGMPAANTGTQVKGVPVHVPIGGVFVNPPSNEGTIITGSKTVHVMGSSGARLTSMVITCNDPVNLPTSVVMSVPMGPPVFTGGPTAVDWLSVALSAIRTRWVSDKLHDLLGAKPGSWRSKIICFFTGHPVEVVSGRVMTDSVDFQLPGSLPFKFERNYCSASDYVGPLGHRWHHSYDQHISIRSGETSLRLGDGREISVDSISIGEEIYEPIERLTIRRQFDSFIVLTVDRNTLTFGPELPSGKFPLRRIEDRNRNVISLEYVDSQLVSITDCSGRLIRIQNDSEGRITALVVSHPYIVGRRVPVARFAYDSAGDLIAAYDALDHAYHYEYRGHRLIKETNRNGLSFHFEYDSEARDARCVHTWGDGGIYDHRLNFYPAARITVVENSLGAKTIYHWNDFGLVTKIIDGHGGERTFGWDRFCRKTSETDPEGNRQTWEYTHNGLLKRHTNAIGGETKFEYNENGLPIALIDTADRRWIRQYDLVGNVIAAGLQGDPLWHYRRDNRGNVVVITNPSGYSRTFAYDRAGLIIRATDYDDNTAHFNRDGFGLLEEEIDVIGNRIQRSYDLRGNLIRVRRPDHTEVRFDYDPEGNRIRRSAPGDATYVYEYGPLSQLICYQRPSGRKVNFIYDSEGQLRIIVNEKNEHWLYGYDYLGRIVRERDFSGHMRRYEYDRAGRLKKRIASNGDTTCFERNALGQLVYKYSSDGTFGKYEYGSDGLISCARNQWTTVTLNRNAYGKVLHEVQGTHSISSSYDARGLRTECRTSSGSIAKCVYNSNGDLQTLFLGNDELLSFVKDAIGRDIERKLAKVGGVDAFRLRFAYDSHSRLTQQSASVDLGQAGEQSFVRENVFRYDGKGMLAATDNSRFGSVNYHYDADGLVRDVVRDHGPNEHFAYDLAGNVLAVDIDDRDRGPEPIQDRRTGPGGRPERVSATATYKYDDNGRLAEKYENGRRWIFDWTVENSLRSVLSASGERWLYEYDPFGRRISKTGPNGSTTYLWDSTVVAEEIPDRGTGDGSTTWIYEPRSFRPLAQIYRNKAYMCVTDHLGTPIELVGSDGELGWSGRLTTWGKLQDQVISGANCPIRFQGQWWDQESGLHYNLNRYYDPTSGAYLTSDPIGRLGGIRPYGYVHNPLNWIDPLGLASNSLFRGDDGYGRGDPMGLPMGSDADITTPWDHVRKESTESSIFTSFAESKKAADKFGDDVYKVSREELEKLAREGHIELYTPEDVYNLMMMDADEAIRNDADNVRKIMEKNEEVLVEGQIPGDKVKKCKG